MSVIGLLAVLAAYVPSVTTVIGSTGAETIMLIAAITLVFAAVVSILIDRNPPERYNDYSRYILGYAGRIRQISADQSLTARAKSARLDEVLILAHKNIEDVRAKWPWVDDDS